MGFQHMPEIVRQAAGRKGGKLKIRKGLGAMPEEQRKTIAAMGGKAKHANRSRNENQQNEATKSQPSSNLGDLLGDLDGQS